MDYGTSFFKYGPISLGETPELMENRGYFPDKDAIMTRIMGEGREVVVGKDIPMYLEAREDLPSRLVYPFRNGVIEKNDNRAWQVVEEISRVAFRDFTLKEEGFTGFYVVASLSAVAPRYMYEKLFEIYRKIDSEDHTVAAATIIPQPLAVAISHKVPTSVVVESGHGNTQITPISRYPVRTAIIALNRGGGDANSITAEILKDSGYGDLAKEETVVRQVKEQIGLVPRNLDDAIRFGRENPDKLAVTINIPGTRLRITLDENAWLRFLIGEYVFNPNHEMFQSYFARGMPKPGDVKVGDAFFLGMVDMAEAIVQSIEKCPVELQPYLYKQIILSGGNFEWRVPQGLESMCVNSVDKIRIMLSEKGLSDVGIMMASSPKYSVWRGCIVYGYAVPEGFNWSWDKMEGWMRFR
jgi:crenactin